MNASRTLMKRFAHIVVVTAAALTFTAASRDVVYAQETKAPATPMLYKQDSAENIAALFAKLSQDKSNRVVESESETRIEAPRENAMYTFTRPGNAAHPSFARSVFGQRQGKVFIETTGATAGDRATFEKWFAGFLRDDEKIRAKLNPR